MDGTPEEPRANWPTDAGIIAKMNAYRQKIDCYLKGDCMHPWDEAAPPVKSRIHGFDLISENINDRAVQPHNLQTTWHYLEKIVEKSCSTPNSRYMVLLEGMSPRMVDIIGVQLSIPPEFWVAHFKYHLHVTDSSMARKESQMYWKVYLPQRFQLERKDTPDNDYDIFFGNCNRGWESLTDPAFNEKTFGEGSFWGTRIGTGSWIFLFLMDPSYGFLCSREKYKNPDSIYPTFKLLPQEPNPVGGYLYVASDASRNGAKKFYPLRTSVWDLLVEAYKESRPLLSNDLTSCTSVLQGVICTVWEAQSLEERDNDPIWVASTSYAEYIDQIDPDRPDRILQISEDISLRHRNLMLRRIYFQCHLKWLHQTILAFGHDDPESTVAFRGVEFSEVSKRWMVLYDRYRWRDRTLASNMTMYSEHTAMTEALISKLQAVAAIAQTKAANEQAESANRLARSAGQLAKIATVAVPCTVTASILSMNGEFAAGERLFFVYWCVAVPITIVLLSWIIYRDILALIRRTATKISSDSGKAELG